MPKYNEDLCAVCVKKKLGHDDTMLLLALMKTGYVGEAGVEFYDDEKMAEYIADCIKEDRLRYIQYVREGVYRGRLGSTPEINEYPMKFVEFFMGYGGKSGIGWLGTIDVRYTLVLKAIEELTERMETNEKGRLTSTKSSSIRA